MPSRRSSTRIVTGAYDPASGTCLAISFMMSGLPITSRTIFGVSSPVSLRRIAPRSSSMNSMSSVVPSPFRTTFSSSAKVRTLLVALANSSMSGWPTADFSDARISWKGLDDTTLNRSISTLLVVMTLPSFKLPAGFRMMASLQSLRALQYQKLGRQQINRFPVLIEHRAPHGDDGLVRLGPRRRDFNDFTFDVQDITRTRRSRPSDFSAHADEAVRKWKTSCDQESHCDCRRMPTARRQSLKDACLG